MKGRRFIQAMLGVLALAGMLWWAGAWAWAQERKASGYTGYPISLNLKDADLVTVLHLIAEETGLNLIVADDVGGKVDVHLKNVPWDQALDEILRAHDLVKRQVGRVLHVYTVDGLRRELEVKKILREDAEQEMAAQAKAREEQEMGRPLVSRVFSVQYAKAPELQKNLAPFLSKDSKGQPRGSIEVNEFSNSLLVKDMPEVLDEIERMLRRLDRPTPQILIEARVVQVDTSAARELGIQWGGQYAEHGSGGEKWAYGISGGPGGLAPSTWTSGSFTSGTGADFIPGSSWMVNLPATLIAPAPAIGFQVGRLAGDVINLDLRLSAAETEQRLKILSRPKIVAMDNTEAIIKRGEEIPYIVPKETGAAVEVEYKEANLELRVRPHVIGEKRIAMDITLKNDARTDDFVLAETSQFPIIARQEATTRALLRDGETMVLGGIIQETRRENESGVPYLRDVPIFSWLFERKSRTKETQELLIFITPWILGLEEGV